MVGWAVGSVRRGALILAASAAGYMALEIASYQNIYPEGIDPQQFAVFADNPATRMLQGAPTGITDAAGFAVWDGGWVLQVIVGLWALLVGTRVLRGEEDSGRTELLLTGAITARRATLLTVLVVVGGAVLTGLAAAVGLAAFGAPLSGSLAYGLSLGAFAALFAGLGAMTAQVFGVRRRAAGVAAAGLGTTFVIRMLANSAEDRAWLGWLTPFGWMDRLRPFSGIDGRPLVLLVATAVLLVAAAVWLRGSRDTGGSLRGEVESRPARRFALGGPGRFAWRSQLGVLLAWSLGLGAYGFMLGSLITVTIDFVRSDETYGQMMADLGMDLTAEGFLGMMGVTLTVAFALYVAWRVAAVRQEESTGRLDQLLSRPVGRARWLGTHLVLALLEAVQLSLVVALSLLLGARSSGTREVGLGDVVITVANAWSVVALVACLGVLAFGLLPRLTLAVPVTVTVGGYVLAMLGPALSWPAWLVDLSPLAHLAFAPAETIAVGEAGVMAAIAGAAAAAGIVGFTRRDLQGA